MSRQPNRTVVAVLTGHWLSLLGTGLVTTAAISWILALPLQVRGHVANPYIGILLFVALPVLFVFGLLLIPAGMYLSRRKMRRGWEATAIDRKALVRRLAVFLGVTTMLNVVIGSQLTYRAVQHMDSVQFCGATCHVMKPFWSTYQNAIHSRVACVECHVAPGAAGWVESKVAGTRQLAEVVFNSYPRPVPSGLESGRLTPPGEACERCHWPGKGGGVRVRVIPHYSEDAGNTRSYTVLSFSTAGKTAWQGIHGSHYGEGTRIRYTAKDSRRQHISRVEHTDGQTGAVKTYVENGAREEDPAKLIHYEMQCVDCHSQPAHAFPLAESALDRAMASGEVPTALPFLKKRGLEWLEGNYGSQGQAVRAIEEGVRQAYGRDGGSGAEAERAARGLSAVYVRYVFPDLKVGWGTYPNHLGHTASAGCFRCHDGEHAAPDGTVITQDCGTCHQLLAVGEADPGILKTLGVSSGTSGMAQR